MNRKNRRQLKFNTTERTNHMNKTDWRINGLTANNISRLTGLTAKEINSLRRGQQYKIDNEGNIGDFIVYFEYRHRILIIKSYIVTGKAGNTYTLILQDGIIIHDPKFNSDNYENCMYTGSGGNYDAFVHRTIYQIPKELLRGESKFIDVNLHVPVA